MLTRASYGVQRLAPGAWAITSLGVVLLRRFATEAEAVAEAERLEARWRQRITEITDDEREQAFANPEGRGG